MKWISPLILFLLLVTASCSQKGSNVNLKVSSNFVFGGSQLQSIAGGGLMVWGQSTTGEVFGQALEDKDELKLSLQNGTWTFYAMAWDGSKEYSGTTNPSNNTPFGGVARCGKSLQVALDGNPVSVSLTVDTAGCSNNDFLGTVGITSGEMPKLKMQFCSDITNISAASNKCTDDLTDANRKSYRAPVGSFRVKLKQFNNNIKIAEGLASKCVSVATGTNIPNLPAGGPDLPFRTTLEYYLGDAACDNAPVVPIVRGVQTLELPLGVAQGVAGSKYFTDTSSHYQFVQLTPATVCNGRTGTDLGGVPFAAGDGTASHPFVICSVPQWYAINGVGAFVQHYKLQADLDFNPYSVGLGNALLVQKDCLGPGTNFLPLGYEYANCSGGTGDDLALGTMATFSGSIHGNGFSFRNLRFRADDQHNIGLIAKVSGTNINIGDFILDKPEISGNYKVGVIAGEVIGSVSKTAIQIYNIKVTGLNVDARKEAPANSNNSDVGGLIGLLNYGTLSKVFIYNGKVRGDLSRVGGVVGHANNSDLIKISAEVDVEANSSHTKIEIGGLIGRVDTSTLNWVKHEGGITTNGTQVGGLVGSISGVSSIQNFYTITSLFTNDGSPVNKLGGVIGWWNNIPGAQILGPGYSLSQVKSTCTSGCSQGSITGHISGDVPTSTALYVLSDLNSGVGDSPGTVPNGLTSRALADIKSTSLMNALPDTNNDDWKLLTGVYPRFDFENHPCSSGLSGTGAGTASSPTLVCTENQYFALAGTAGTFLKLMANIRLQNNSTMQFEIPTFSANLNGNNKSIIGGFSDFAVGNSTAHIGTLNGSITNLKIHGMGRKRTPDGGASQPGAVFVNTNNGTLYNIDVYTHSFIQKYGAGLVGHNNTSGKLQNIRYFGRVNGEYSLASLVYKNSGTIENAKVYGELKCNNAACSFFSGVVTQNYGTLSKIKAGTRMQDDLGKATDNVSMIVDENHGTIQDVVVPKHTTFRTNGTAAYYYHRANVGGSLTRVANFGKLIFGEFNPGVTMNGFPTNLTAINVDSGTHTNVLRGGVSGKELLVDAPFTCSGNMPQVDSSHWATLSAWSSTFSSYNSLGAADRKLVMLLDRDGDKQFHQVTIISGTTLAFPFSACNSPGKLSLYWTNDILVTPETSTPASGVMLPQMASNAANFGGSWRPLIWDSNDVLDQQAMMSYYAYMLGVSTINPGTPAIWELDDEGELTLFDLD